jgi:hypothetical protein
VTTTDPTQAGKNRPRRAEFVAVVFGVLVLASAGIVGAAAFESASGRISDSTGNTSTLLAAGKIELQLGSIESLLFDADGLYPGLTVERCLTVVYDGTIGEADIRLSAWEERGDGLADFLESSITVGSGEDPECTDYVAASTLSDGRLVDLWTDHPDFPAGLVIGDRIVPGFATTVRFALTVADDNAAQGLDTDFWLTVEARP